MDVRVGYSGLSAEHRTGSAQIHARYIAGPPKVNAQPGSEPPSGPGHRTQGAWVSISNP